MLWLAVFSFSKCVCLCAHTQKTMKLGRVWLCIDEPLGGVLLFLLGCFSLSAPLGLSDFLSSHTRTFSFPVRHLVGTVLSLINPALTRPPRWGTASTNHCLRIPSRGSCAPRWKMVSDCFAGGGRIVLLNGSKALVLIMARPVGWTMLAG